MLQWVGGADTALVVHLDGRGSTGQGDKSASSFIFDRWAGRLQQVVDTPDEPGSLRRVGVANLAGRRHDQGGVQVKRPTVVV